MPRNTKLSVLQEYIDLSISNAANAEKIFSIATGLGIKTSIHSIAQFVARHRKASKTPEPVKPEPVKPTPELEPVKPKEPDLAVDTFESIVETIYALRKYVAETVEENSRLRERLRRIKELVE